MSSSTAVRRFGADRGEDAGREVGDRGRGREPHAAGAARSASCGEGAAVGTRREVRVERVGSSRPGSSPSSRAEIAWRICMQVIRGSRLRSSAEFPPVSSVAVDDLTRLFLAARDGDRTALLHAVRASQADVWRLASHLVGPDDADDVTQDTFVRAWQALPAFRGDSSARTWLLSIARRACADAVRGATCAAAGWPNAPTQRPRAAAPRATVDPSGAHAVHGAGRRARPTTSAPRSCSPRWSAAPTRRPPTIVRRARRHHPLARRPRARATSSTRCARPETG